MSRIDRQAFRAQSRQEAVGYQQQRQATRAANPNATHEQRQRFRTNGIATSDAWAGRKATDAQGTFSQSRINLWNQSAEQANDFLWRREGLRQANPNASAADRQAFREQGRQSRQQWFGNEPLR